MIAKSQMPLEDNKHPRVHIAKLTGFRARANWAQQNGFEAFPLFAASVIGAHATAVPSSTITMWSVAFVVLRILYIVLYVFDKATLRTLVWGLGISCCIVLLVKSGLTSV